MITKSKRWFYVPCIILLLIAGVTTNLKITIAAGDPYTFDYQDYWKEYKEWGYLPGSRLPCNGTNEGSCTWAWKPWYRHTTDVPRYGAEMWEGRTVSGYAMMMHSYKDSGHNMDAGIFRVENTEMCRTYRFTMNLRSGLEPATPVSADARMQIGLSPTGYAPDQVVLTDADFGKIVWSEAINPRYTYQNVSVEAQALGTSVGVFTRATSPNDGSPYFFWDEGSFKEVPHTGNLVDVAQPLPNPVGGLAPTANPSATSATIAWYTPAETLGQVLYRAVGGGGSEPGEAGPYAVYLPYITGGGQGGEWLTTSVQDWTTSHNISLTNLTPGTTYEYVVVSYGLYSGQCATLITESATPRTFTTPAG